MKFRRNAVKFLVLVIVVSMSAMFFGCETMGMKKSSASDMGEAMAMKQSSGSEMAHKGHGMTMHHQHQTMNHALGMILQGSNLVMLGQMGMIPAIDSFTIDHGNMMMRSGSDLWNSMMSGDVMMKMHAAGTTPEDDPAMGYTHKLAEAQLKVINLLKKHADMKHHTMTMHHQHIMMNHALKMVLEGSDLTMTGQMGMAPGVDEVSITHGKMMRKGAWDMLNEVLSGSAMMKMHEEGMKPTSHKGMEFTHELGSAIMQVMTLLDKMP
jgi:hypothetical protein